MDRDAHIAKLRAACGCKEGLAAFALALAAYIFLPQYFPNSQTIWGVVLTGIGVALGGAIVGKLGGLLIAQLRLWRLLRTPSVVDRVEVEGARDFGLHP